MEKLQKYNYCQEVKIMVGYKKVAVVFRSRSEEAMAKYASIYGLENLKYTTDSSGYCCIFVANSANPSSSGNIELFLKSKTYSIPGGNKTVTKRTSSISSPNLELMKKYGNVDIAMLEKYQKSPEIYAITCGDEKETYAKVVKEAYKYTNRGSIKSSLLWLSSGGLQEVSDKIKEGTYLKTGSVMVTENLDIIFKGMHTVEVNAQFFAFCQGSIIVDRFMGNVNDHIKSYFSKEFAGKIFKAMLKGEIVEEFNTPLKKVLLSCHKTEYRYFSNDFLVEFFSLLRIWLNNRIYELATSEWEDLDMLNASMLMIVKTQLTFDAMKDK
jgi:hypothetical protein